jgi:predicted ATPase
LGTKELRQALAKYLGEGNKVFSPSFQGMIAELEAMTGDEGSAMASVDAGLARAGEMGERWSDSLLFRRKGEILLQRDHGNPAPAEEAFRTALAIAKEQGARSFELRAALSLAKVYQSTARPADAHAVLAPALEGFSPSREMPEIAEAQSLLEQMKSPSGKPG